MLAKTLNEILAKFDFTDSIITQVKWSENLLDLIVVVDYYWDIQTGNKGTRQLRLIFRNCTKAHFERDKTLPITSETNLYSQFTIVLVKEAPSSRSCLNQPRNIEIFTTDYRKPWLSVSCSEAILEE